MKPLMNHEFEHKIGATQAFLARHEIRMPDATEAVIYSLWRRQNRLSWTSLINAGGHVRGRDFEIMPTWKPNSEALIVPDDMVDAIIMRRHHAPQGVDGWIRVAEVFWQRLLVA